MAECNANSDKWSVVKAALLFGGYPNIARTTGSCHAYGAKKWRVITADQQKFFMLDPQDQVMHFYTRLKYLI